MKYDPSKETSMWNYRVEVEYYTNDQPTLEKSKFFGNEKDAAAFVNHFDFSNGDIYGWNGKISESLLH